ncbi:MAG: GFA family protein [Gammaproteobacteria bacterium]
MRTRDFEGGCLCGNIRFRARGPVSNPHTCSCRMCQRHTGALTVAWVEFPRDAVEWVGAGGSPAMWRSSPSSSRAFCAVCGSSIGAIDDAPVIALLVGAFDAVGRKALAPVSHSRVSARPRWWRVHAEAGT